MLQIQGWQKWHSSVSNGKAVEMFFNSGHMTSLILMILIAEKEKFDRTICINAKNFHRKLVHNKLKCWDPEAFRSRQRLDGPKNVQFLLCIEMEAEGSKTCMGT
ncbi:hypothetical protein CEXT_86611 [Caerostris extrusa]|uniref:Uncharacterized protein n=1 Tax=Caerostris extrusa TaxID=172846 RepID=A0AAV4N5N1_CAEEX|nr:hypothetical protein CEXT_86611 [Caerostris extrusa]